MRTFTAALGGRPVTVHAPEPGADSMSGYLRQVVPAAERAGSLIGLDVEGTALTDLGHWDPGFGLRTVQLAPDDDTVWVFTLHDSDQLGAVVYLLTDPRFTFASHTGMDVLSVGVVLGVDITTRNVDTRGLAQSVYTRKGADRDLKTLASMHGMPELAEAERALHDRFVELHRAAHPERGRRAVADAELQRFGWTAIGLDDPVFLVYAGLDAVAARRLVPVLVPLTHAPARVLEVDRWLEGQANRIQMRGMLVDQDRLDQLETEASSATRGAEARIADLTGGIKARSPKLKDWLARHGVEWDRWESEGGELTATGAPSLAKGNVRVLRRFELDGDGAQVAEELERFQSYADRLLKAKGVRDHLSPDGRIHPLLNPTGATATARMSAAGPNMQNFSAATRGVLVPDPGWALGSVDLDQVELRTVAGLAREAKMIETILAGGDLHQLTADQIGRPRQVAKPTNFLIVYGGGGPALRRVTGLPLGECQSIIRDWRAAYPAIDAYSRYVGMERDAVYTISGRRLPVTYTPDGDARNWANVNYMVQSAARDLLVDAWLALDAAGYGDSVWYPIHDELVLMAPEDRIEEVVAAAVEAMTMDFLGVPITAGGVVLRDEEGVSRWMDGHEAQDVAERMGWAR